MQVIDHRSPQELLEEADLKDVPTERLEQEIVRYAAMIAAITCRWLLLLAEFDRREAWRSWDCISAAQWLSWQCGLDPVTAREHLRVARALLELPKIREAFGHGLLSYSKVRALSRSATPESEETLLEIARHTTAAQTERIARAHRRGRRVAGLEEFNQTHQKRFLRYYNQEDGAFILSVKLTPDEGARVVAALERAQLIARKRRKASEIQDKGDDSTGEAWEPTSAGLVDAFLQLCESAMNSELGTRSGGDRQQVIVHVDLDTLQNETDCGRCEIQGGPAIAPETAKRIGCDCSRVGVLLDKSRPVGVGRKSRTIPSWLRRALNSRDNGCRFPGCDQQIFIEAHHITHWINGGETSLENLLELCWFHHLMVHEGGYSVQLFKNGEVLFRRKNGSLVESDAVRALTREELEESLRSQAKTTNPRATVPTLSDTPMDVNYIVSGLLDLELKRLEEPPWTVRQNN